MISARFLKSSLAYTVGGALPLIAGFILLPLYTDYLSIIQYGEFALILAISLLLQVIFSYSTDAYIGSHFHQYSDAGQLTNFVASVFGFLFKFGITIAIPLGVAVYLLLRFNTTINSIDLVWYSIIITITSFFNSFFKSYAYLFVFQREAKMYLLISITSFTLTVTASSLWLYQEPYSLNGPVAGRLISAGGVFLLCLYSFIKRFGFRTELNFQLEGFHRFCLSYLGYLILVWIFGNLDRFILNSYVDTEAVGIFDFAVKCVVVIDIVQNGLSAAIYPEVFKRWSESSAVGSDPATNRYFNVFTAASILLVSFFLIVIPIVLPVVIHNKEYDQAYGLMGILAASFTTRGQYHYYMSIILHLKKTSLLPLLFLVLAVMQIGITIPLSAKWGLSGVVFAFVLSKYVQLLVLHFTVKSFSTLQFNLVKIFWLPMIYILTSLAVYYISSYSFNLIYTIIQSIIITTVIYFIYRREAWELLSQWKTKISRR